MQNLFHLNLRATLIDDLPMRTDMIINAIVSKGKLPEDFLYPDHRLFKRISWKDHFLDGLAAWRDGRDILIDATSPLPDDFDEETSDVSELTLFQFLDWLMPYLYRPDELTFIGYYKLPYRRFPHMIAVSRDALNVINLGKIFESDKTMIIDPKTKRLMEFPELGDLKKLIGQDDCDECGECKADPEESN